MSQPNKFAAALKGGSREIATDAPGAALATHTLQTPPEPVKTQEKASRRHTKHIGGYFDPAVSRQLRQIGLEEDATVQDLMAEALDMLFQSRKKSPIARRPVQE